MNENVTIKRLGNIYGDKHGTGHAGNVWATEYICPTLNTAQGGCRTPMVIEKESIKDNITKENKYV